MMTNDTHDSRIAVLEEQVRNARAELAKQAREYERRLDELNHSQQFRILIYFVIGQVVSTSCILSAVMLHK